MMIFSWIASWFAKDGSIAKSIEFAVKVFTLFEQYEKQDSSAKSAAIDTLIALIAEYKPVIASA